MPRHRGSVMSRGIRDPYNWGICSWGDCQAPTVDDLGICQAHAIKAYAWVLAKHRETLDTWAAERPPHDEPEPRLGYVYALRFDGLVKIGFTRDLAQRMLAIPHDELVGLAPGGYREEAQVHAILAPWRHKGEWFRYTPEVAEWIATHMPIAPPNADGPRVPAPGSSPLAGR